MVNESKITFNAEIVQTTSKKTSSLDVVYRLTLQSDEAAMFALGSLEGDQLVKVTVEPADG